MSGELALKNGLCCSGGGCTLCLRGITGMRAVHFLCGTWAVVELDFRFFGFGVSGFRSETPRLRKKMNIVSQGRFHLCCSMLRRFRV